MNISAPQVIAPFNVATEEGSQPGSKTVVSAAFGMTAWLPCPQAAGKWVTLGSPKADFSSVFLECFGRGFGTNLRSKSFI
jgi:hypothetical protein